MKDTAFLSGLFCVLSGPTYGCTTWHVVLFCTLKCFMVGTLWGEWSRDIITLCTCFNCSFRKGYQFNDLSSMSVYTYILDPMNLEWGSVVDWPQSTN